MKALVALVFICVANFSFADAYKCINGDGKYEYQEKPCASGKKLILNVTSSINDPDATNIPQELIEKYNALVAQKKIVPGMTASMLIKAWGKPNRTNINISQNDKSEQWIYDRGNYVFDYVYVEKGLIKTIQVSK